MPDSFYRIKNKTNSTVAQLNSTFGTAVNELRVHAISASATSAARSPFEERPFPFVRVDLSSGTDVARGTRELLDGQRARSGRLEITDDFTWLKGKHTLTIGTHNEFFKFRNLFIRDNFGNYRFTSLDLFEQGLAQRYDYSFSLTGDPLQPARVPRPAVRVLRRRPVARARRT